MTAANRTAALEQLLARRIAVLDGAMGTMLQSFQLEEKDFRGQRFADHGRDLKGDNELLVLTRTAEGYERRELIPVRFVPMRGEAEER